MKKYFILVLAIQFLSGLPARPLAPEKNEYGFAPPCSMFGRLESRVRKDISPEIRKPQVLGLLDNLPLYFVENTGQVNEQVTYMAKMKGETVYFTAEEIVYQFILGDIAPSEKPAAHQPRKLAPVTSTNLRIKFIGANKAVSVLGESEAEAKFTYLLGKDPEKWVKGAKSCTGIRYRGLYPGIDLAVRGEGARLKTEYLISSGADPSRIGLSIEGAKEVKINQQGQLEIRLEAGIVVEDVPRSYQVVGEKRIEVETGFRLDEMGIVRFAVGRCREDLDLVIDPLIYSTFLGGSLYDSVGAAAVDQLGNVYVAGVTYSLNFPTTEGAFDSAVWGTADAFVAKINASGSGLVYSTYIGGENYDGASDIAVDGNGYAHVAGTTSSWSFPGGGFLGESDAFVVKLNPSGTAYSYSVCIGSFGSDYGAAIALDGAGNAYLVNNRTDYASPPWPKRATFVNKLNSAGGGAFVQMIDGSDTDVGNDIAVDAAGNAFVTGFTLSTDLPATAGAYDNGFNGGTDAFAAKLDATGNIAYLSYLGGTGDDFGMAVAAGEDGLACIAGYTVSANFPVTGAAFDASHNGAADVFLAKLNSGGSGLVFSTFIGGTSDDSCLGLSTDASGNYYLTGGTYSGNFPTTAGAYDSGYGGNGDAFAAMVSSSGASLLYSTYLGGSDSDGGRAIIADGGGKAVIAGNTGSADFPLSGTPLDSSYNGTKDAFITKLLISEMFLVPFGSLDNGNANIANIGASAANVTLSILESSGAVVGNKNFSIPPHGIVRSWDQIGNIFDFGKPVTLAITADQPLVGDNIKWAGPPYDTVGAGFTCAPLGLMKGREFYFPFSSFGGWANAYCVIANVSAQDASVNIQLTDGGGALKSSTTFTLPARGIVRSWDHIGSIQAIADPALLRIVSDREVVIEAVRWEENKRGWGFAIFPSSVGTGTGFAVPFGSLDNGNINLGNTGTGPANVTLTIRNAGGTVIGTESFTIPALGVIRSWDIIGNIYNYGKPLTVEITSSQPLAADNIKWAGPPYETVGAGFSCGPLDLMKGKVFYFPFSSFAAWTNAYCVIANITDQTLEGGMGIYNSAGVLKKSANFSIGPRGVVRGWDVIGSIQAVADPALVLVVTTNEAVVETVRWEENRRGWGFAVLPWVK